MADIKNRFDGSWPVSDKAVKKQLLAAFESGNWGSYHGPFCDQLVSRLSEIYQRDHVALTCSGTIAVELALRAVGVTAGDEVIIAGYDYPGNFRCIEVIGALPVLVDIQERTWSLNATDLPQAISSRTKAVIVSSLHGGMPDMRAVMQCASHSGIAVIEDVCQAPGATWDGQRLGTFGDVTVLSFGGSKLLTAGRGGAVLCQDAAHMQRLTVYKDRGNDAFPLSELQACVLLPQLKKLAELHERRRVNAMSLLQATARCSGVSGLTVNDRNSPAFYKVGWVLDDPQRRDTVLSAARQCGVPLFDGFRGFVKRSPRRCRKPVGLINSEAAALGTVLLHHPVLLAEPDVIFQLAKTLQQVLQS